MAPLREVHQNKQFKEKNFALFSSCFHLKDILSFAFLVLRQKIKTTIKNLVKS